MLHTLANIIINVWSGFSQNLLSRQFFHFELPSFARGDWHALTLILIKLKSFPALMAECFSCDFIVNTIIAEGRTFKAVGIQLSSRQNLRSFSQI